MEKVALEEFLKLRETEKVLPNVIIDGKSKLREYKIWKGIKNRTTNPDRKDAIHYMQKGIKCSKEWFNNFEQFLWDMGLAPNITFSIDRIDGSKGYSKDNCRWADQKTQCSNRGEFNLVYEYNGESKVLKAWAEHFNIKYTTLYNRIFREGMTFEEAIVFVNLTPLTEFNGETKPLKDWCAQFNIDYKVVHDRIYKHKWSVKDALTIPKGERRKK